MKHGTTTLSCSTARIKILHLEAFGFLLSIAACWLTEAFDAAFHLNHVFIQTTLLLALGAFTIISTARFLSRIRQLEGMLAICASCKRVRADGLWISIESFMEAKSDLLLSHSICPECTQKLYGDVLTREVHVKPRARTVQHKLSLLPQHARTL